MAEHESHQHRQIFQQYHNYIYAIVWRILRNVAAPEDIDECVSDIFAEVFFHLDSVYEGSLKAYLGTVARRTAIDTFRKLSAVQNRTVSLDDDSLGELRDRTDISLEYEQSEQAQTLLNAVLQLGEPDSSIIIQKYYYDRTASEIAEIVHLNPAAVRMRMSRALKRLRKTLEEHL